MVRRDPDIAFLTKLFPLKIHPEAYAISKSIVCSNSLAMLEASFAGRPVSPPLCDTPVVDQTLALAGELGINSTPTLILPDGSVIAGSRKAEDLLRLLGSKAVTGSPPPDASNWDLASRLSPTVLASGREAAWK